MFGDRNLGARCRLGEAPTEPPVGVRGVCVTALAGLLAALAIGCVAAPRIPGAAPNLLDFLKDGQTTRQDVIVSLGQPSGTFEHEGILTYRVGHDAEQGYYLVIHRQIGSWEVITAYSLVLVFDDQGILRQHKLVPVQ